MQTVKTNLTVKQNIQTYQHETCDNSLKHLMIVSTGKEREYLKRLAIVKSFECSPKDKHGRAICRNNLL